MSIAALTARAYVLLSNTTMATIWQRTTHVCTIGNIYSLTTHQWPQHLHAVVCIARRCSSDAYVLYYHMLLYHLVGSFVALVTRSTGRKPASVRVYTCVCVRACVRCSYNYLLRNISILVEACGGGRRVARGRRRGSRHAPKNGWTLIILTWFFSPTICLLRLK